MADSLSTKHSAPTRCGYSAIVGRPNVGKSTLFNRMLGVHLSPVTHKRQTTRYNIRGILSDDKTQLIFIDTPGMHVHRQHHFNAILNQNASNALNDADVLLFMVVAGECTDEDQRLLRAIKQYDKPCLLLINKVDCVSDKTQLLAEMRDWSQRHAFVALVPISARYDKNFSTLKEAVAPCLPESEFLFSQQWVSDRSQRFIAAELIREQLMAGLNQELPYAIHVTVERFARRDQIIHIEALIFVERKTQKGIVLGAHGERLKRIATRARTRLQTVLKSQVYLSLRVRVLQGWQRNPAIVAGYLEA